MSYLTRLLRGSQLFKYQPIISRKGIVAGTTSRICIYKPSVSMSTDSKNSNEDKHEIKFDKNAKGEYIVKFKEMDVKKIFKEFYSIYGPLFVAIHIGVSLTSLGFFCSLVWLSIDPTKFMPDFFMNLVGRKAMELTGASSKFFVAYAIHKVILPLRLGATIWLTTRFGGKIKLKRQANSKKSDNEL